MIYLRSHLGRYLSVDSFGNVLCESEERDAGSRFQISIAEDGSGRWALRNESRGYFLGGTPDKLTCTAKAPSNGEFWSVHLAARPQVIIKINSLNKSICLENLIKIRNENQDTVDANEIKIDQVFLHVGSYALFILVKCPFARKQIKSNLF